jgi:PPOX class probable F420-dependent enzyme
MAVTFDGVSKAQYVLLTTFTKDGRPKPTPICIARDGARALVMTENNSWKVRRIRNTSRVTLAVCNRRGKGPQRAGRGGGHSTR